MLKFDPDTGALAIDAAFHDDRGNPGFDSTIAPGRTAGPARRSRTGSCSRGNTSGSVRIAHPSVRYRKG